MVHESALKLLELDLLLVLDLFLHILVPLQKLVVLSLPELKTLIQIRLELFLECIHFVLLLLDKLSLGRNNLLVTGLHVRLALMDLHFLAV